MATRQTQFPQGSLQTAQLLGGSFSRGLDQGFRIRDAREARRAQFEAAATRRRARLDEEFRKRAFQGGQEQRRVEGRLRQRVGERLIDRAIPGRSSLGLSFEQRLALGALRNRGTTTTVDPTGRVMQVPEDPVASFTRLRSGLSGAGLDIGRGGAQQQLDPRAIEDLMQRFPSLQGALSGLGQGGAQSFVDPRLQDILRRRMFGPPISEELDVLRSGRQF